MPGAGNRRIRRDLTAELPGRRACHDQDWPARYPSKKDRLSGFDAAKSYFIDYGKILTWNYLSGKNEGYAVYGKKGEKNWQSIAMSEGWAKYNEWLLAKKHIQYNSLYQVMWNYNKRTPKDRYLEKYKEKDFPFNYSVMFYELHNAGCSIKDMEISLSTNTLAGLRDNLIAKYPSDKKETITPVRRSVKFDNLCVRHSVSLCRS